MVAIPCVLWDFLDRLCMGKPLQGVTMKIARWVAHTVHPITKHAVKHEEDSFMVCILVLLGTAVPALFFVNLYVTLTTGFNWKMCLAYHVLRIGPYFMNVSSSLIRRCLCNKREKMRREGKTGCARGVCRGGGPWPWAWAWAWAWWQIEK